MDNYDFILSSDPITIPDRIDKVFGGVYSTFMVATTFSKKLYMLFNIYDRSTFNLNENSEFCFFRGLNVLSVSCGGQFIIVKTGSQNHTFFC